MRPTAIMIAFFLTFPPVAHANETGGALLRAGPVNEPARQELRQKLRPPFSGQTPPGGVIVDIPPSEEGRKPFPVKTILVMERDSSSITLRWHDRSDVEEGTRLRRREESGDWQEITAWGPLSGFNDHSDTGLASDRLYCYQFIAFNEHGDSFSPQRCAYTAGAEFLPVWRAQARFGTANVSNANSDFSYDLELTGLKDLTDITMVHIAKGGDDAWCIEFFELLVNNRLVFREEFGDTESGCLWLDNEGAAKTGHTIDHQALRDHTAWRNYTQPFQLTIPQGEIESRLEGMIGNLIAADDRIKWGGKHGRAWVEATKRADNTIHIDLDLEGDNFGPNPDIDIDFDIVVRFTQNEGIWELEIRTGSLEADVDFDWFTETLSFILPCGPIVSVALDEGIPDCISALEDRIGRKISRGWQPIAKHFTVGNPCPAGRHPVATVTDSADVALSCESDPPPPQPTAGTAPPAGPVLGPSQ
jgi:hypothetical protein